MKFDKYALKARVMPTVITLYLPFFIFSYFFINDELAKFIGALAEWKIISSLSISGIFMVLLSEINRGISKAVFERAYFEDEVKMPTTNLLLLSDNTYTNQYKNKIREKIKKEFDIDLLSDDEEKLDQIHARKAIVEAVALIRTQLRENAFLLQHNIEYGFMRNLIGGASVGAVLSIINLVFFHDVETQALAFYLSATSLIIYVVLVLGGKQIARFYGGRYAKTLYQEFLIER